MTCKIKICINLWALQSFVGSLRPAGESCWAWEDDFMEFDWLDVVGKAIPNRAFFVQANPLNEQLISIVIDLGYDAAQMRVIEPIHGVSVHLVDVVPVDRIIVAGRHVKAGSDIHWHSPDRLEASIKNFFAWTVHKLANQSLNFSYKD